MMVERGFLQWLVAILAILDRVMSLDLVSANCHFSVIDENKLYNYSFSLVSPIPFFPHGVQSEDGFYKVTANETVIWFQLCDGMIFNHNTPRCVDCWDCGGPSRCGMDCSALMANNIGGYDVCTTIGRASSMDIDIIDRENPNTGVIVKMSSSSPKLNCSLSVSVICDPNRFQGPHSLKQTGKCDYATVLAHPSGCAEIVHVHGKGWGWFGTLGIIFLCLFGAYLLAGAVYRYFSLGVSGIHIIPNLDFWTSLPQRLQSLVASLLRKFRGSSQGHRSSYSSVNF